MSYSDQSYYQCEDCSRNILERKNKKNCRTCGKTLCMECNYSNFGYCKECRQKFEDRPAEEKYNIMRAFKGALKAGPVFFTFLGVILGIASLVLVILYFTLVNQGVLGTIAAIELPLSIFFFWIANKIRKKNERGLEEVDRRIVEFRTQISPEGLGQKRTYSTQYRQTTQNFYQKAPATQPTLSEIPIKIIKDPEIRRKTAYIPLWVFASFLMISGVIHIGLSFSWFPFIFISIGEMGLSTLLFWLGSGIKKGKWVTTRGKAGSVRIVRNPNEPPINVERTKKSLKTARVVIWFFIVILSIGTISHFFVFIFVKERLFGILSGIELIVTFLLVLLNKLIRTKMQNRSI